MQEDRRREALLRRCREERIEPPGGAERIVGAAGSRSVMQVEPRRSAELIASRAGARALATRERRAVAGRCDATGASMTR